MEQKQAAPGVVGASLPISAVAPGELHGISLGLADGPPRVIQRRKGTAERFCGRLRLAEDFRRGMVGAGVPWQQRSGVLSYLLAISSYARGIGSGPNRRSLSALPYNICTPHLRGRGCRVDCVAETRNREPIAAVPRKNPALCCPSNDFEMRRNPKWRVRRQGRRLPWVCFCSLESGGMVLATHELRLAPTSGSTRVEDTPPAVREAS